MAHISCFLNPGLYGTLCTTVKYGNKIITWADKMQKPSILYVQRNSRYGWYRGYHHGGAVCWFSGMASKFIAIPSTETSLRWADQGLGRRVLFNCVDWQRKKLMSEHINFSLVFYFLRTRSLPKQWYHAFLTSLSGCASSAVPPLSSLHVFGWFLCALKVWQPSNAAVNFCSWLFLLLNSTTPTME